MEITSGKNGGLTLDANKGKKQFFKEQTGIVFNVKEKIEDQKQSIKKQEEYDTVIVNDFNDDYHMSEEERSAKYQYYEVFKRVRKCKRKYRKLPEYVRAFRVCLDCLDAIAENNGVYTPDKFKKLVSKGDIKVYGLNFPKYIGKDKKTINWDYVISVINDRSIPESIFEKKQDEFDIDDVDDIDEFRQQMFGDDYDAIFNEARTGLELREDKDTQVGKYDSKMQMSIYESIPSLQSIIRDFKRQVNRQNKMSSYVFELAESDFEYMRKLDNARGISDGMPKFKGDIMDDKAFEKYMADLEIWYRENVKIAYKGKNKTPDEIRMLELKDAFEEAGWNVRAICKYDKEIDNKKKKEKEDKKKEKKLKKKLIKIQKRREKKGDKKKNKKKKDGKEKSG